MSDYPPRAPGDSQATDKQPARQMLIDEFSCSVKLKYRSVVLLLVNANSGPLLFIRAKCASLLRGGARGVAFDVVARAIVPQNRPPAQPPA